MTLDLRADPRTLTAALVDIPSESRHETALADAVQSALEGQTSGFEVIRHGNTVLARTNYDLPSRVILAGHLDTVPVADNVPSKLVVADGREMLSGCGAVDMKSGVAVFLHTAATIADPVCDMTLIFYDCEEIAAEFNGLGAVERALPEWLTGDFAILGEPSDGWVEAGCQGSIRVQIRSSGVRAHSARSWLGRNAIHELAPVLDRLANYEPRRVTIDGCEYREGLSAVHIAGGVAGNVVPDSADLRVNFRFAPDRSVAGAIAHVHEVFAGLPVDIEVLDRAAGALPGLQAPAAQRFLAAVAENGSSGVRAKYGWTDVSRFAARGIPAVNFGPGDPNLAHKPEEHVVLDQITEVTALLRSYLTGNHSDAAAR